MPFDKNIPFNEQTHPSTTGMGHVYPNFPI